MVVSVKSRIEPSVLVLADEAVDFARFFERHVDRARRLAWRLVGGDEAAADDVVQEAFAKAYRGLAGFRAEARLETWLHRIVVNEAASHHRRQRLWRLLLGGVPPEPPASRDLQGDPGLRRLITRAIRRLSRGQREAFVLVHLEGYTVREAASLCGKSEGSVKRHLHRALRRLRAELAPLREGERDG